MLPASLIKSPLSGMLTSNSLKKGGNYRDKLLHHYVYKPLNCTAPHYYHAMHQHFSPFFDSKQVYNTLNGHNHLEHIKEGGGDAREHLIHHPTMPRTEEQTSKMSAQLTVWMQGMISSKNPLCY